MPRARFRFQTGSIKSKIPKFAEPLINSFDSKLVRLKVSLVMYCFSVKMCFDSKLVRLKGFQVLSIPCGFLCGFDSKLVRLKVEAELVLPTVKKSSFDSKLVRLKVPVAPSVFARRVLVSIPNWFD